MAQQKPRKKRVTKKRDLQEDLQAIKQSGWKAWVANNKKKAALLGVVAVVGLLLLVRFFTGTPLPPPVD